MSRHILIIDDDPATSQIVEQLAPAELPVRSVPSAEDALTAIPDDPPALIVLSADLAGGYHACRQLKKDRALRAIPLLLISAEATHDQFKEHAKLPTRADMYIHKPIDGMVLVKALRRHLPGAVTPHDAPLDAAPPPPPPPTIDDDQAKALKSVTRERDALREEVAALSERVQTLKQAHQRVEAGFDNERTRLKERIDELTAQLAQAGPPAAAEPGGDEELRRELRRYKHLYADLFDGVAAIREALRVPRDILAQHHELRAEIGLTDEPGAEEADVGDQPEPESSLSFDDLADIFDDSSL